MQFHPESNTYVKDGEAFVLNGTQYPATWDKASLGFIEVTTVGTRENDAYFWISEDVKDGVRTITNTPKDPEQIAQMESAKKLAEIDALEGGNPLARPTREFMLASIEERAVAAGYTLEQLRESHYGYRKVKEADEVIKALRAAL
jgi:thiamine monophosphate synthase